MILTYDKANKYMDYFIDSLIHKYTAHYRIISNKPIPFPKNYFLIKHDRNIEVSNIPWDKHPNKGWGMPDIMTGQLEIRYLWKDFPILTLEEFLKNE